MLSFVNSLSPYHSVDHQLTSFNPVVDVRVALTNLVMSKTGKTQIKR